MKQQQQNVILEDDLSNTVSDLHATTENNIGQENESNYHQSYFEVAHPPPSQSQPLTKRKRNLPGNPDPEAEVISLSPTTLMATNRFVCEMCNKGFQRDQNLQLHRRGHNLPWKLKQRNKNEVVRKKVYVCPEVNCVHHEPSRALGDLTGIKKHFCRKHGEKKWKCDKCSKKYAVQSDWKAHSKTCGTREYKCDCGTLFSRRDSFITHRAFCDALAQESARTITGLDPAFPGQIPTHILDPGHTSNSFLKKEENPLLLFPPSWLQSQDQDRSPSSISCGSHMISYHPAPSAAAYMSATALLQKAAQMGTTHLSSSRGTSLQAPCTSTTSSLVGGPHHQPYIPHVSANSPAAAGNNTCGTSSSSLLEADIACAGGPHNPSFIHPENMSMMTLMMMSEDGFADVATFDDAFSQILDTNTKKEEEDDNNNNNNNMMMMNMMMHESKSGNMTRDFLGLKDGDGDGDGDDDI
ncbi:protein indeterminate-domain 7-like, partial [Bidens hawaiensis]|uniref:protein indeterminate-domain 7-like n=1 Tax=Bidens hawaiensis TaxID=980011 RepID=UPI0040498761